MPGKVSGVAELNRNMDKLVGRIKGPRTEGAILRILMAGEVYAVNLTPVDTSALINSRYRNVYSTSKGMSGRLGYTAAYSQFVHDGGPKNWQKPGAEDKFLEKGFERDGRDEIQRIVVEEYRQ